MRHFTYTVGPRGRNASWRKLANISEPVYPVFCIFHAHEDYLVPLCIVDFLHNFPRKTSTSLLAADANLTKSTCEWSKSNRLRRGVIDVSSELLHQEPEEKTLTLPLDSPAKNP